MPLLLLAMIHPEPSCPFIPHAKRMYGQWDGAVRIQCGRRVTVRTQSRLQSVDTHESSQNKVVWPFFTSLLSLYFLLTFLLAQPELGHWAVGLGLGRRGTVHLFSGCLLPRSRDGAECTGNRGEKCKPGAGNPKRREGVQFPSL